MTLNLDDLEEVARDATPGPWIADPPSAWGTDDVGGYQLQAAVRVKDSGSITWDDHGGEVFKPADAEFIATFDPPTMFTLIAKLREAEAVIVNVEDFVTRHYLDTRMGQAVLALTDAYKHTNQEGDDDGT